jgi:hypothetical protein
MKTRVAMILATLSTSLALVLIAGCSKQERVREIDWAKAALARNPTMEIIATDESAGVFTVRDTSNGSTFKLRLDDLVAGPPPPKAVAQPAAPAAPPAAAPEPAAVPGEEAARQTTETVAANPPGAGRPLVEGPGYSISKGEPVAPPPTIEGPGYSITREAPRSVPNAEQSSPSAEALVSNVEKRTDPIICQGDRLMRIDGETIDFEGDAVIAEKGCDLYISNARIRAGGVGIIARQARVHIVNSTIGGTKGSYEASEGAEIYVARSTFAGVGRRFDNATMNDLGGNEYKLTH